MPLTLENSRFAEVIAYDAKQEGRKEGRKEGRLEGKLEGRLEGKLEGKQEGKIEESIRTNFHNAIKCYIKGFSEEDILYISNLSKNDYDMIIEKYKELGEAVYDWIENVYLKNLKN